MTAVGRFVAPLRAKKGTARSFKSVEPASETMAKLEEVKKKRPPTALQVAHWITFKENTRSPLYARPYPLLNKTG